MASEPRNVVVIGGGGHAKVVVSLLKRLVQYRPIGFTDLERRPDLLGLSYLGRDTELDSIVRRFAPCSVALGIGNTGISEHRLEILRPMKAAGFHFPALVAPSAIVHPETIVGDGTVVLDGAILVAGSQVGEACILNHGCVVDHDSRVADGVHIAPGAVLCGGVDVGVCSLIGAGAVVVQYKRIGARCLIGAGATVTTDIQEPGVYCGTPARPFR